MRIAVRSAGVHLLDTMIRSGRSGGPFPLPELPMTPGREVAGVVDELGADAAAAHRAVETSATIGKSVLVP